jgi:hypothetical protein
VKLNVNKQKVTIILLFLIVALFGAKYFFKKSAKASNKVQVTLYNKSKYNIDSLYFGGKYYNIKSKSSLTINDSKGFSTQGSLPFGFPEGIIKGKYYDTTKIGHCGTGVKSIRKGNYHFDILLTEANNYFRLHWAAH